MNSYQLQILLSAFSDEMQKISGVAVDDLMSRLAKRKAMRAAAPPSAEVLAGRQRVRGMLDELMSGNRKTEMFSAPVARPMPAARPAMPIPQQAAPAPRRPIPVPQGGVMPTPLGGGVPPQFGGIANYARGIL